ncbi:MAG TPA: hypothetical protein VFH39_05050 [Candidatus Saccharimonadales bacterium]|nr:hypothetical protein [Candidatus Saccharimonadales bacterium]
MSENSEHLRDVYDWRPYYIYTPEAGTVSEFSVIDPPLPVTEDQMGILAGLPLVVHEFHTHKNLQEDMPANEQPVAEVRIADIVKALRAASGEKIRQFWAAQWDAYLKNVISSNPSYRGKGIARALGPTLDLLVEHGELHEVVPDQAVDEYWLPPDAQQAS